MLTGGKIMAISCGNNSNSCNLSLAQHLSEFIGKTVTIFTTSGGVSGCGFTGCILSVNSCFVRLLTELGSAPPSPVTDTGCESETRAKGLFDNLGGYGVGNSKNSPKLGTICDIPIDKIAAFCHNSV